MKHVVITCLLLLLSACSEPPAPPAALAPVKVVAAPPERRDTVVEKDFVGRVAATNEVEIRAKVTGLVTKVEFREGEEVSEGQVLFRLEADSLGANVNDARARLAQAEAEYTRTATEAGRYKLLADKGTVSRQTYDNASAAEKAAGATVASARAQLEQAQLSMKDAVIISPYSGRIGRALIKEGGLVSAGSTVLATVATTTTARFDFAINDKDYLALVRPRLESQASGEAVPPPPLVTLVLSDGSIYPGQGTISFADRALSEATDSLNISADFPNPAGVLLPGLYGRARLPVARFPDALLVPQRAVQEVLDRTFLTLVDSQGKAVQREVTLGPRTGEYWVVSAGLAPEEQVIIEGHHKVRPGMVVEVISPDSGTAAASPSQLDAG